MRYMGDYPFYGELQYPADENTGLGSFLGNVELTGWQNFTFWSKLHKSAAQNWEIEFSIHPTDKTKFVGIFMTNTSLVETVQ
jgi:hypothetical protein